MDSFRSYCLGLQAGIVTPCFVLVRHCSPQVARTKWKQVFLSLLASRNKTTKKIFIPIIIMILLVVIVGGYCWRQKNQTIISKTEKVSCETLKDILSVSFSPENVRQRFLECFPERTTSTIPLSPNAPSGSTSHWNSNRTRADLRWTRSYFFGAVYSARRSG